MRKLGWTWDDVNATPNTVILELIAAQRLEDERTSRTPGG